MHIVFNGKTYNSPEEMSANDRQAYESMFQIFTDKNGNGIPDFLEGDIAKNVMTAFTNVIHYDGKVYNSMDELPVEARQKVQEAIAKLNQMGIVTAMPSAPGSRKTPAFEPAFESSKPLLQSESTIQESGRWNWMVIVGFLGAVLLCAVAIFVVIALMR